MEWMRSHTVSISAPAHNAWRSFSQTLDERLEKVVTCVTSDDYTSLFIVQMVETHLIRCLVTNEHATGCLNEPIVTRSVCGTISVEFCPESLHATHSALGRQT